MFGRKKVWVLIDDIAGNANQAIAVAKALGLPYEVKKIKYNFFSFLPNWLKIGFCGVNLEKSDNLDRDLPDIIISGGRKTAKVSAVLKKMHPDIFNVHLMNPDMCYKNFNLVCLPYHDKKEFHKKAENVMYTIGAPCFLDQDLMKKKMTEFSSKLEGFNKPFVCLMIGGKTKNGDYSIEELEDLVEQAVSLTTQIKGSLFISTSRRTNKQFLAESLNDCKVPYYFFDWHLADMADNPYLAFLKMSDYFIITGDSVSICSEALSTGRPVYIYRNSEFLSPKHQKFLDYLFEQNYIRYFSQDLAKLEHWEYEPLNEAKKICEIIKDKI